MLFSKWSTTRDDIGELRTTSKKAARMALCLGGFFWFPLAMPAIVFAYCGKTEYVVYHYYLTIYH